MKLKEPQQGSQTFRIQEGATRRIDRIGSRARTGRTLAGAGRGSSSAAPPTTPRSSAPLRASGATRRGTGTRTAPSVHLNTEDLREIDHGPGEGRDNIHRVDNLPQSPALTNDQRVRIIGLASSQLRLRSWSSQTPGPATNQSQKRPPLPLHLSPRRRGATTLSAHTRCGR